MGLIKKIISALTSPGQSAAAGYLLAVRCSQCGETIRTRLDLYNHLSVNDEAGESGYICRKTLIGSRRCFQRIEVVLKFDQERKLVARDIVGGEFIDG